MTPTETTAFLRRYNAWRRGEDETQPQPDPREIGEAIDAAIEMIERLEAAEKERDALRAKIEAMERQVPICRAEDLRHAEILLPSLGLMPEDKLYALPGAQPAPSLASGDVSLISEGKTQPAPIIPEGWKLVPIEPTPEMREAGVFAGSTYYDVAEATYEAMLAAAPEAKP